jgi:multiple sugar transport system permease protein
MATAVSTPQAQTTAQTRRRNFWSSQNPLWFLLPAVALLLVYSIFPLVYNIYNSFREFDPLTKNFVWVGVENWQRLFNDGRALNAASVTLRYGAIALSVELVLGMSIALLFDAGVYLRGLWQTLIILPMVAPPSVVGIMFKLLENSEFGVISWVLYSLNILDKSEPLLGGSGKHALAGVLLADIWQWTPFCILILLAGLKALPIEPLEAAEVDGASRWQTFWRIKLPLLSPVISIVVLFRVIDLYRLFDYIYVMTSGGPGTATETISYYAYTTYALIDWGYTATLGVAILVVIWISAFIYTRVFKVQW